MGGFSWLNVMTKARWTLWRETLPCVTLQTERIPKLYLALQQPRCAFRGRNETRALEQERNPKPASPQGFPTRWTIAATREIALQMGNLLPEDLGGHDQGIKTRLRSRYQKQIYLDHFTSRAIGSVSAISRSRNKRTATGENNPGRRRLALFFDMLLRKERKREWRREIGIEVACWA